MSPSPLLRCLLVLLAVGCATDEGSGTCTPGDVDGVVGSAATVLLAVNDAQFAVGAADSGSTQRNITVQNLTHLTLTLTNAGTTPHSLAVACIATDLPAECPQTSCFPPEANFAPVNPGESVTHDFVVPRVEGAYPFASDVAGDEALVGEFVVN